MNETNQQTVEILGGVRRLVAMTGVRIVYDNDTNTVNLHFPRKGGVSVRYTSADLFDVSHYKVGKYGDLKTLSPKVTGLYADMLRSHIEKITGLYLSL